MNWLKLGNTKGMRRKEREREIDRQPESEKLIFQSTYEF